MFTYVKNVVISFFFSLLFGSLFSAALLWPTPTASPSLSGFQQRGLWNNCKLQVIINVNKRNRRVLMWKLIWQGVVMIYFLYFGYIRFCTSVYIFIFICMCCCTWCLFLIYYIKNKHSRTQRSEAERSAAHRSTSLRCQQVGHLSPGSGIDETWQLNAHIKQSSACSSCQQST